MEADEGFKFPGFEYTTSLANWVHGSPSILIEGRVAHMPPVIPEMEEPPSEEELLKLKRQRDPFEIRLKELNADKPPKGLPTCWTLRVLGDKLSFNTPFFDDSEPPVQKRTHNQLVFIRNLIWPGYTFISQVIFFLKLDPQADGLWRFRESSLAQYTSEPA